MKVCKVCEIEKEVSEFYKHPQGFLGVAGTCKICKNIKDKKYRDDNKEKLKISKAAYYQKNQELICKKVKAYRETDPEKTKRLAAANYQRNKTKHRDTRLKLIYGVGQEEYNRMFKQQNGLCAICGCTQEPNLCIDHNHDTKEVRGLLCHKCNRGIGFLNDNPVLLKKAIDYLVQCGR